MSGHFGGRSWERRRARLSHDDLKNQVLPLVSRLVRVLAGEVWAPGFLGEFVERGFRQVENVCGEVGDLLRTAKMEASPKGLFEVPPLTGCPLETLEWMPDAIHEHWLWERNVEARMRGALLKVEEALGALEELRRALSDGEVVDAESAAHVLMGRLAHLGDSLSSLGGLMPYRC